MSELLGVDLSDYRKGFDLAQYRPDFAIMKATGGIGVIHETCDPYYQQAKNLGILRGVYHFAADCGLHDAKAEARFFVDNVKGYIGDGMLILDVEHESLRRRPEWALEWLEEVRRLTGIKPVFYTYSSFEQAADYREIVKADYGLWLAGYPKGYTPIWGLKNSTQIKCPYTLRNWSFAMMWQYTSNGRFGNYPEGIDCNQFYGDAKTWNAYVTSGKPAPSPIAPAAPTFDPAIIDTLAKEVLAGKYGNGQERRRALGDKYGKVQNRVNDLLKEGYTPAPIKITPKPAPPVPKVEEKPTPPPPTPAPPLPVRHARREKPAYEIQDVIKWITPARRKAIYKMIKYVLLGFASYGIITSGNVDTATHAVESALEYAPELLGAIAMILADSHTPRKAK